MDSGMASRLVADRFGVGRTQILRTHKRKAEYMSDYEKNAPSERKRKMRKTGNEDINALLWQWFQDATARTISVTGPMLQEKALVFAKDLGNSDFKGSNGWLESFLKRHNIVFGVMSGESGDVDLGVVSEWKSKISDLCKGYEPRDIFNMDESGLFYRDTINKSFHVKGDDCSGGKRSKERLTISLCANMLGEKEKLLVIGKSLKPRCFKKIVPSQLPVTYYANKKAWMTSAIFEDWLKTFERKMKRQGRQVLLFLDNAPSHPKLTLKNVKLCFFPPNTTSKVQPMDQGIIQALKLKFRKRQLQNVLTQMDKQKTLTGSQLLKQISILDAIYWVNRAWLDVDPQTIVKCFANAGFVNNGNDTNTTVDGDDDDDDDNNDNVPLSVLKLSQDLFGVAFDELCDIDCEIKTCDNDRDWSSSTADILNELKDNEPDDNDSDSDDDDDCSVTAKPVTLAEVQDCLSRMREFALDNGLSTVLKNIMDIDNDVAAMASKKCSSQSKISEYFK